MIFSTITTHNTTCCFRNYLFLKYCVVLSVVIIEKVLIRYINGCIVTGPAGTPCIWRSDIIILVGWCYAGVAWLDAYL